MRTYERLNVEVVKFEAQDVITASVAVQQGPQCECTPSNCYVGTYSGKHWINWGVNGQHLCEGDPNFGGQHNH